MSDEHSSARTAIAREAFPLYLQNEFIDKDKDGSKAFIHFHNHPNMGPGASGTDVSTQESFSKYPWFLFVLSLLHKTKFHNGRVANFYPLEKMAHSKQSSA